MGKALANIELKFGLTERIPLSGQIMDPLGINPLKSMESALLEGITSQTRRFSYYAFRNWLWYKKEQGDLHHNLRAIERIVTVVSAAHHPMSDNPPGIPEFASKLAELKSWPPKQWTTLYEEYKGGRPPHSEQYYSGPLRDFRMVWIDTTEKIWRSKASTRAAKAYEMARKTPRFLTESHEPTRNELASGTDHCFCGHGVSNEEREIWTHIFLGFRVGCNESSDIGTDDAKAFTEGTTDIQGTQNRAISTLLGIETSDEDDASLFTTIKEEEGSRTSDILRRYSLLLILAIADQAGIPKETMDQRRQTIRDAVFYNQVWTPDGWAKINLMSLEPTRQVWATLVHNLYHISAMEAILHDLVEASVMHPGGAVLRDLIPEMTPNDFLLIKNATGVDIKPNSRLIELVSVIREVRKTKKFDIALAQYQRSSRLSERSCRSSKEVILAELAGLQFYYWKHH